VGGGIFSDSFVGNFSQSVPVKAILRIGKVIDMSLI